MNETQPAHSRRSSFFQFLTVGVLLAFFLLPILFNGGFSQEQAQWNAARATRMYNAGEKQKAIELLTAATTESNDSLLDLQLADWQYEAGNYTTAIEICDSILKQYQVFGDEDETVEVQLNRTSAKRVRAATRRKADCLILQGQKAEAHQIVVDMASFYTREASRESSRRNELAYYRALCGKELKQAEEEIGSVFNDLDRLSSKDPISFVGQVCFSLGLVSRYTDQQELAIKAINRRIDNIEYASGKQADEVHQSLYQLMKRFVPLDAKQYSKSNELRKRLDRAVYELAMLRAVKALLLEDLGMTQAASNERHLVAKLNRDADAMLKKLPEDRYCLGVLSKGTQLLDTRGYVHAVRGNNALALYDLNLAVAASEVLRASTETELYNSAEIQDVQQDRELTRRTCAVIHYHRMQVYEAESTLGLAQLERDRIVALGFEPGDDLF